MVCHHLTSLVAIGIVLVEICFSLSRDQARPHNSRFR